MSSPLPKEEINANSLKTFITGNLCQISAENPNQQMLIFKRKHIGNIVIPAVFYAFDV